MARGPLRAFLAVFLLWAILRALGDSLAMYLNGIHMLRPQVILVLLFVAVSIPSKILLAATSSLTGFVVASILSYLVATVIPIFTYFRKEIFSAIAK